jgi:hypothetical protein
MPVDERFASIGSADVLTTRDVEALGHRLEAALDRGFRQIILTMTSLMIVGYSAIVLAILLR